MHTFPNGRTSHDQTVWSPFATTYVILTLTVDVLRFKWYIRECMSIWSALYTSVSLEWGLQLINVLYSDWTCMLCICVLQNHVTSCRTLLYLDTGASPFWPVYYDIKYWGEWCVTVLSAVHCMYGGGRTCTMICCWMSFHHVLRSTPNTNQASHVLDTNCQSNVSPG